MHDTACPTCPACGWVNLFTDSGDRGAAQVHHDTVECPHRAPHPACSIGTGADHPRHAFPTVTDDGWTVTASCGGFTEPTQEVTS